MPFAASKPYAASASHGLALLAFVSQCTAQSNTYDSSAPSTAVDLTVIIIAIFAFLLVLVVWYRWLMTRRRARAQPTPMMQNRAILPIFSSPHLLPSQQSYLGENRAALTGAVRQEPPPAYHGKETLEGETVISADTPPAGAETPPAYVTPALVPPPPAYVRDNDTRQPTQTT